MLHNFATILPDLGDPLKLLISADFPNVSLLRFSLHVFSNPEGPDMLTHGAGMWRVCLWLCDSQLMEHRRRVQERYSRTRGLGGEITVWSCPKTLKQACVYVHVYLCSCVIPLWSYPKAYTQVGVCVYAHTCVCM